MNNVKEALCLETVLGAIKKCLPDSLATVPLHEPSFNGNEWLYVKECIDTGWVSSSGSFVGRFEKLLSEITDLHCVAVVNGTAALHMSLLLSGVTVNDEVLLPSLTFVATANAITYLGAIPHFVDCEEATIGVDPNKLDRWLKEIADRRSDGTYNKRTGRRIKALIVMHTFGHPSDLDALAEVCQDFNLELVEDAAQAIGSLYKGRHVGQTGKISAMSFNGNKMITTGGGGAILTKDESIAKVAKHLTTTARLPHPWLVSHDQVAYNYRMPNLNAALGCAQLEQLPTFLQRKRALTGRYAEAFANVSGLRLVKEPHFATSNYWLNALLLDEHESIQRDPILELTNSHGIMTRAAWQPLHTLPMFGDCPKMELRTVENLAARIINLPSSPSLG